jgi:hypothetical protein
MNPRDQALSGIAAALLAVAVFSMFSGPIVCLASASACFVLSLYLRRRGAFRSDAGPLIGALLIGGSAAMVLTGIFLVSLYAALIVAGVILVPVLLFAAALFARERWRSFLRFLDPPSDEKPPPT